MPTACMSCGPLRFSNPTYGSVGRANRIAVRTDARFEAGFASGFAMIPKAKELADTGA